MTRDPQVTIVDNGRKMSRLGRFSSTLGQNLSTVGRNLSPPDRNMSPFVKVDRLESLAR
ncbi:protein of unknown function (plasmid) [Paraburkholderia dioscoreae]|uniref:Uncharacterized protein n=1 Tax=Paraburkholderia dioscoreae TaxID=2604047 RepID=A0A5Q4YWU0_9BURK|nr:protein of unknown function [Paraburkholderia dioscoreae]